MNNKDFSDLLRSYREKHNLSQEQMAQLMGVTWITVQRWESGKTKPYAYNLSKFSCLAKGVKK